MIQYQLRCNNDHPFEGWFPSIAEFERQQEMRLLICPLCDSTQVDRDIMSPRIGKGKNKTKTDKFDQITPDTMLPAAAARDILRRIRKHIVKDYENVGNKFVKAYRLHEKGDRDDKFYGTPDKQEIKELMEEGVNLFHVPEIKDDA